MNRENLEVSFDELYQDQNFSSNTDNYKKLSDKKKNDIVFLQGNKLTTTKIK